ncbi:YezD family protein [Bacillus sp. Marseille-P3661]|uniref:YezD family protein n=1 Tax=Bacillus sp. Marseille-P3661 TaxID=1936234 RepID=UPI0021559743|nr:YezD family protein [Bacillus sp. Marseille-P3661]
MNSLDETKVNHILSTLKGIEYGSLVITVHNGEITQIDVTEKKRFTLKKTENKNNG